MGVDWCHVNADETMSFIRPAAVAGLFYPNDPETLATTVRGLLTRAAANGHPVPKALIVPHAGYIYSGETAATAYARVVPARGRIHRVVLLGPCHRVAVRGLATSAAEAFATPLGRVHIDADARRRALTLPQVGIFEATHEKEHSLEVHLPFLQIALGDIELVPFVVGDASANEVAQVLDLLWGGEETLIVVSSDLSHYLDYEAARQSDAATCRAIETLTPDSIGRDQACGRVPIRGLLQVARQRNLLSETLDLRNSGDTAGTRDKVVGYGAWAFVEPPTTVALSRPFGEILLQLAAASIRHGLDTGEPLTVKLADYPRELGQEGACFVTLKHGSRLRGCIGSYRARRPLAIDVAEHAFNAAFRDPRFPPLTAGEIPGLALSIAVLGPKSALAAKDEAALIDLLRPDIDGLIIQDGDKQALFLPAVWESLRKPAEFVRLLKQKAGLAADHWSATLRCWRFTVEHIASADLADPASLWTVPPGKP